MTEPGNSNRGRQIAGIALFAVALAGAVGFTWYVTSGKRTPVKPTTAAGGHDHAAMAAMSGGGEGDQPRPVAISTAEAKRIGVTYAVAALDAVSRTIGVVGQVVPDETRQSAVSLKLDGWVERLWISYTGRAVRKGEPMLALYSPMLVSAQDELLLALRHAQSMTGADSDGVSSARSLVESARRRLRQWDVSDDDIRQLEATGQTRRALTLVAPTSGIVTVKNVVVGQQVAAGQTLLQLADLSTVWVEGEVFEQDLAAIRVGQGVDVELRALPGTVLKGRVAYVYPTLDPTTRTARIRVAMPNGQGTLKPGMYATMRLLAPGRPGAVSVPRSAVLTTGQRSLVFVRRSDGKLAPHPVVLGAASDDRVEILDGIALGDTVVASATFLLDAESNLGTAMGGMGDMPGMDMTAPVDAPPSSTVTPAPKGMPNMPGMPNMGPRKPPVKRAPAPADPHAGHKMPDDVDREDASAC